MRKFIVTGTKPSAEDLLTLEAVNALRLADCIVATKLAERFKKQDASIIGSGRQHLLFIGNDDIKEDFRVQSGLKHHFLFTETGVASLSNKRKSELAKDIHI